MLLSETSVVMKHSHKGGHCFCTFAHLVVLKRNQRNIYQGKGLKHEHATRSSMNTLLQVAVSIVEHENLFEANSFSETWTKKILCFDMINQLRNLPEMRMRFFARTHKIVFTEG